MHVIVCSAISDTIAEGEETDDKEKNIGNLQAQNELKFLHQIALYHLTYRLGRIRPYYLADIFSVNSVMYVVLCCIVLCCV